MHALIFGTMPFNRCFVIFLKDFFFGTNLLLLSEGYHCWMKVCNWIEMQLILSLLKFFFPAFCPCLHHLRRLYDREHY